MMNFLGKVILLGLLLSSFSYGKSLEEVEQKVLQKVSQMGQEMQQKFSQIVSEQEAQMRQDGEYQRLVPHCYQFKDKGACKKIVNFVVKKCDEGMVYACFSLFKGFLEGEKDFFEADEHKARNYADKICTMDSTFCIAMSGAYKDKNEKLALKYAEKACEMGETLACGMLVGFYYEKRENPQKVKYYADKICKAGVSEVCEWLKTIH